MAYSNCTAKYWHILKNWQPLIDPRFMKNYYRVHRSPLEYGILRKKTNAMRHARRRHGERDSRLLVAFTPLTTEASVH
jgi:hypothetical protein